MLQLNRVSRIFENGTGLKNATFDVNKGELIGIIGKSGCGKSTLLRNIAGLDIDYTGELTIHDEVIRGPHKEIGVVFQEARLMPWLTVVENVAFGLTGGKKENMETAKHYLRHVGLEHATDLYVRQLSGGMAQRVAIARALAAKPEILLMDEPFSALDAFTKMQLQDLVLDIWREQNLTAVIVTHDLDEALYLCDRIVLLSGKPGEVDTIFTMNEQRPRSRGDANLAALKASILERLEIEGVRVHQ